MCLQDLAIGQRSNIIRRRRTINIASPVDTPANPRRIAIRVNSTVNHVVVQFRGDDGTWTTYVQTSTNNTNRPLEIDLARDGMLVTEEFRVLAVADGAITFIVEVEADNLLSRAVQQEVADMRGVRQ